METGDMTYYKDDIIDLSKREDQIELAKWSTGPAIELIRYDEINSNMIPGTFPLETVDYRVVDAVVTLESQWNYDEVSPDNAIGLGQIVPTGWEWGLFKPLYREKEGKELSDEALFDPYVNITATAFGLGARLSSLNPEQGQPANTNWLDAAIRYFGCNSYSDTGDRYTTCTQYAQTIEQNIRDAYGDKAVDEVRRGKLPPLAERVPTKLLGKTMPADPITGKIGEIYDSTVEALKEIYEDLLNKAAAAGVLLLAGIISAGIIAAFYAASHKEEIKSAAMTAAKL
jgi:hypothetical protein